FCFPSTSTSSTYTLSLHDALPIFDGQLALASRFQLDRDASGIQPAAARPAADVVAEAEDVRILRDDVGELHLVPHHLLEPNPLKDRKSTRLNSSHVEISYAVFCLK